MHSGERPGLRPLTGDERDVLDFLLVDDLPHVRALRAQARTVRASRGCSCGCATIDLHVAPDAPVAEPDDRYPLEATVVNAAGRVVGGLLLFVHDGRISCLEVYPLDDDPMPMPSVDRVQL